MTADGLEPKLHPRQVHPTRHFLLIILCLAGTSFIDLSGYPETPAVLAYSAMLVGMMLTAAHWVYIARHKNDVPETHDEHLQN